MAGIFEIQAFFWRHRVSIVIGLAAEAFKNLTYISTLKYKYLVRILCVLKIHILCTHPI